MDNIKHFELFSIPHLVAISIIFLTAMGFVAIARKQSLQNLVKPAGWVLALVLVGHELVWVIGAIALGKWNYTWGLPLQLCDLAVFAVAIVLIKHYQWIWELAYFWGLGGSLQAVLTPDLRVVFPDYVFIKFFVSHGCIVIGVIFLAAGCRRAINFRSVVRVFLITNIYAAFIGLFNRVFGTNYLYLCARPSQPSILDYVGSGNLYIFGLEAVFTISLIVYYLPFLFAEKFSRLRRSL